MSYVLAIVTFLVGTALGTSVARQRIVRRAASAPSGRESTAVGVRAAEVPGSLDEIIVAALDALPSGVVIADANGSVLFKNSSARAISGVRHIDVLVDEAVEAMVKSATSAETQHRRFDTAGSPSRAFDIRTSGWRTAPSSRPSKT